MKDDQKKSLLVMNSQVIGVLSAAAQDGDEKALQTGAWVAGSATNYNYLNHAEATERREKQKECMGGNETACSRVTELNALDKRRDQALQSTCRADAASAACGKLLVDARIARESFRPYEGTPEWNAQINDDPLLQQYSFQREVQSITNALAQTPQTTPELKRLVEAIVGTAVDFTVAGDVKALLEAETPFDYLIASVGVVPGAGDAAVLGIKKAKELFKEGKVAESAKVLEDLAGGAKGKGSETPYNPQTTRNELESTYGRDNVLSTTVPPVDGRNVHLAGQRHPVTGVVFDNRGFPIFDDVTAFDTRISIDAFKSASYEGQMKLATKDLLGAIQQGQVKASSFTANQLQQISAGAKKIDGYTWHHHQDSGRMQLVPELIHKKTGHIGGEAMGGGM